MKKYEQNENIQVESSEKEILYQSSVNFFRIFDIYRKEKKISVQKLVQGVMSSRAFFDIKKGKNVFSKTDWEFLMQRMGIVTDYFEVIVSKRELEEWRKREDICLLVLEEPKKAEYLLEQYEKYCLQEKKIMSRIQQQFCIKMKWMLSRSALTPDELYELSCDAVTCTVVDENWQEKLISLCLGPAELEAMLLVVWSYWLQGNITKAIDLYWKIKNYPVHWKWEPRMQQMIIPQIAWVGMTIYEKMNADEVAYNLGQDAIELLRDQCSQRYAYTILEKMIQIGIKQDVQETKQRELQQLKDFKTTFETIYKTHQLPCMRMWQCSSIKNSYDISFVLKRMRSSMEKTQEEICVDENGFSFLSVKQLSRIEKGENRPSGEVFQYLVKKMEGKLEWIMPMLETESVQVLSIRQDIMYWDGMRQYKKEKELIEKLKQMIGEKNLRKPYIRQEILFMETSLKYETNNITASEALKLYYEALTYTFPIEYLSRKQLPFIRREEGMIISNIAYLYHKIGETSKAQELFEKLYAAFRPQQQIFRVNNPACTIMLGQYSSLLGDLAEYEKAFSIDNINIKFELNSSYLFLINDLLYNQAWDHYEIDKDKYKKEYRQEFLSACKIAEFTKDWASIAFYKEREKKYLG